MDQAGVPPQACDAKMIADLLNGQTQPARPRPLPSAHRAEPRWGGARIDKRGRDISKG